MQILNSKSENLLLIIDTKYLKTSLEAGEKSYCMAEPSTVLVPTWKLFYQQISEHVTEAEI